MSSCPRGPILLPRVGLGHFYPTPDFGPFALPFPEYDGRCSVCGGEREGTVVLCLGQFTPPPRCPRNTSLTNSPCAFSRWNLKYLKYLNPFHLKRNSFFVLVNYYDFLIGDRTLTGVLRAVLNQACSYKGSQMLNCLFISLQGQKHALFYIKSGIL